MKRIFTMLSFFILSVSVSSQPFFYYPNGKPIQFEFKTINDIFDSLNIKETTMYIKGDDFIYFKRLTNKPVLCILEKKNPAIIPQHISSYNYSEYINSYAYYFDLKDMMKNKTLTYEYLVDNFGKPDTHDTADYYNESFIFKKYNLKVNFTVGCPVSVDILNYNAIAKNKLSILEFSVTGTDYSIGMDISVYNLSDKAIKYISFTVRAKNPVGDLVGDKTVKGIGPIEKDESGSYSFDDIFISSTASKLSLQKIKIQYMDLSIKEIDSKTIKQIIIHDWEKEGRRTIDN